VTITHYRWVDIISMALIAVLYAALGKVVLSYFSATGNVTLIWFPGGMALAVLLLKGLRFWPGVFIGAFIAGLLVDDSFWLCFLIATGNTLESVLAAYWLKRNARFSNELNQPYDLQCLTSVGLGCALVSAAFGPMALWLDGFFPFSAVPAVVVHWWMADAFGIITVTPCILIWRHWPEQWFSKRWVIETLAFMSLSIVLALVMFLDLGHLGLQSQSYWMFVPMFWGAMRFGRHGVQFVAVVTAINALMGVAQGAGYFAHDLEKTGMWNYWLFQILLSWVGTLMALTLFNERQAYAKALTSERRLQAVIDSSPVAYVLNDQHHNITLLNPAFTKLFGHTRNDISNLSDWWAKVLPEPEYRENVTRIWAQRLHQLGQSEYSFQAFGVDVRCANGEIKHVQVGASVLEGTRCGEYLISLLDLTEQVRASRALSDSNLLLQSILETLPLRVFWKDKQMRYLGANQLFAQDAGLDSVAELLGKTDHELAWWVEANRFQSEDQQVMQSGDASLNCEQSRITPTGENIWLRISKLPLRNSQKDIIGILGVYEDISMRKRIEDQLMWRTAFLEALMDSSPDGILAVGADGQKLLQNQRLADLWGIPKEIADNPNDTVQLNFVKNKLKNSQEFVEKVNFLYANPDISARDEIELLDGVILERYSAAVRDRLGNYYGRIWHFTDVTEVRFTQLALQRKEYFQRALLDNFPFAVWLKDKNCHYLAVNRAFTESFSPALERVIGKSDYDIFPREIAEKHRRDDLEVMSSKQQKNLDEAVHLGDKTLWMETYTAPLLGEKNEVLGTVGFTRDISRRKAAEEAQQLAGLVFDNSGEAMLVTDKDNKILNVNSAFCAMTGYSREEVLGQDPKILASGEHDAAFYQAMWQAICTTGQWRGEIKNRRKSGECFVEEISIDTIFDADGKPLRRVALFSDITQRKQTEEQIWRQANFDALTGLPNRRMAREQLEHEIKKALRTEQHLAVLMLDLDRFKEVNDTLGHEIGDELLQHAARRLEACVRESDTVGRLGGDEFVVILTALESISSPTRVAKKIIEQMGLPFDLRDQQVYVSASVGITLYPDDGKELSHLLRNADQAMYAAKNKGRNCYSFFTQSMQAELNKRAAMMNDLRGAVARQEFTLLYQPIVELTSGCVHKAEALLRWRHPQQGMVSPAQFVPVAEQSGLINTIGDWVFQNAVAQAAIWRQTLQADFQISINKSPVQFLDVRHDPADWINYISAYGLPGAALTVEITEGLLLEASPKTAEHLLTFRDAGIQVAIDDFGTGYSALSYLKKFDIDYLKIDQSFVRNLSADSSDLVLCEAIIVMAHKLGLRVIAEGVETPLQRELLTSIGCDYGQGYLFSKPLPPDEFEVRFKMI